MSGSSPQFNNDSSSSDLVLLKPLLMQFEANWRDGLLREQVGFLPPPEDPLRYKALRELVRIDLRQQWQRGRRPRLEGYLHSFPEVGNVDTVPIELIVTEIEVRREHGVPVDLDEYSRRFPVHAARLRAGLNTLSDSGRYSGSQQPTATNTPAPSFAHAVQGQVSIRSQFGRYRILKKLGEGGMGAVYLAEDDALQRQVALKVPSSKVLVSGQASSRFQREARAAAGLNHPNICPVYEVGEVDGVIYYTMAFIQGQSLSELLRSGKRVAPRQAALLVRRLAMALQEAHDRGIIHRDLKPSNVMINERREPVIMDFGLAGILQEGETRQTAEGQVMGTPAYMAPEQAEGNLQAMGPGCDQYSLGIMLYELLTGVLPFGGPTAALIYQILHKDPERPSSIRRDLDPSLEAICLKAINKKAADRFSSCRELANALKNWVLIADGKSASDSSTGTLDSPSASETAPLLDAIPVGLPAATKATPGPSSAPARRAPASSRTAQVLDAVPATRPRRRRIFPVAAIGLVGIAVLLGAWWYFGSGPEVNLSTITVDVDELVGVGDRDRALLLCEAAVRKYPHSSEAYSERGRVLSDLGELDRALADFDKAIELNPENALAFARRGTVHGDKNNLDQAFRDCDHAIRLNPKLSRAYANRGLLQKAKGNLTLALQDFEEAIRLEPDGAGHYVRRAELYEQLDQQKAFADYGESLRIGPTAQAYTSRGDLYRRTGENEKAVEDCTRALAINPKYASAYGIRASARVALEQYDEAIADCTEAVRYSGRYTFALRTRSDAYKALHKYDEAVRDIKVAIQVDPEDRHLKHALAILHNDAAKYHRGEKKWQAAYDQYLDCIKVYTELRDKYPWNTLYRCGVFWAYQALAETYEEEGTGMSAAHYYEKARELGLKDAAMKLAALYESGSKGVKQDSEKAKQLQEDAKAMDNVKKFTVPTKVIGSSRTVTTEVYVFTPRPGVGAVDDEIRRIKEDYGVEMASSVRESFDRLYKIARDNKVSFTELCVYALGAANKEKGDTGGKE